MVKATVELTKRMAYLEAELRTDGVPAIIAFGEEVKARTQKPGIRLHLTVSPQYNSQSLGVVGKVPAADSGTQVGLRGALREASFPSDALWP